MCTRSETITTISSYYVQTSYYIAIRQVVDSGAGLVVAGKNTSCIVDTTLRMYCSATVIYTLLQNELWLFTAVLI